MDQKKEFILHYQSGNYSVTALAEIFGISRPTVYKYIKRYEEFGEPGLLEMSKAPKQVANKTSERVEKEILTLRKKHPRWGASKLLILLEHELPGMDLPKASTINNILKRNGKIKERKKRKKVEPRHPIFDPIRPNEIWSADYKGKFRLGDKQYCYPLTIADSFSRYIFTAKGMYSGNYSNTKQEFTNVFRIYGLPDQIHTDNGAPFGHMNTLGRLTKLAVWFMDLGIQPVYSDPASPEQNGRHERMHRELKAEATRPPGKTLHAQQIKLNHFVKEYNTLRPHEALGMRTPESVHVKSEIEFPESIKEWTYPPSCEVRYVTKTGALRIGKNNWLFIASTLKGRNIGLEELGNGICRIYYRQFFLGYADLKNLKVYDIMDYENE